MRGVHSLGALSALTSAEGEALREHFKRVGFVFERLGAAEAILPNQLDAVRLPIVQWRLRQEKSAGAALTRLFLYDDVLTEPEAREAFGDTFALAALRGLIVAAEGGFVAPLRLSPYFGLWLLGDVLTGDPEVAMGPGATTHALSGLVPMEGAGRVLDLGCGSGTLALLAASRGADAVGLDINPRAVAMAEINARLNGLTARFLVSDIYAAVGDARFDLIVAQPPFVMNPEEGAETTFLHGGRWGDELALRMIAQTPARLVAGGRAHFRIDLLMRPKEPPHGRIRAALGDAPVDLLLLIARGHSIDQAAMAYANVEDPTFGARYAETAHRYLAHMTGLGARESSQTLLTLSLPKVPRPDQSTIVLPLPSVARFSVEALAVLEAGLGHASLPPTALVGHKLSVAPGAQFVERRGAADRNAQSQVSVSFPGSWQGEQSLSESALALVQCLDESPSLGHAIAAYAALLETQATAVEAEVLRMVRELLARGVLRVVR